MARFFVTSGCHLPVPTALSWGAVTTVPRSDEKSWLWGSPVPQTGGGSFSSSMSEARAVWPVGSQPVPSNHFSLAGSLGPGGDPGSAAGTMGSV